MNRIITNELTSRFVAFLIESERSRATINKYSHDLEVFTHFAKGCEIDKNLVVAYKEDLSKRYEITSANSMLAALNAFFRYSEWYDCIVRQFKVQRRIFCEEERELKEGEYKLLINTAERKKNDRISMVIQTICGTGIRVSELSYFTVEGVRTGTVIITCKGKTRKVMIVKKLKEKLLAYAKRHRIATGQIFVTKNGKALDRSNIWREMKKLCKSAGVCAKKVFPHNLRHLFARAFYTIEKDIAKLADILGHSSINTTRIYIVSTGEEHRRQLERMRLIE